MTDTFPPFYPTQILPCPETPVSRLRRTKHLLRRERAVRRMLHTKKRIRGRPIGFLGSKATLLPSISSIHVMPQWPVGGIGVPCHWCHSRVNQRVTGSDGLRVAEWKNPTQRMKSPPVHATMLTFSSLFFILYFLILWGITLYFHGYLHRLIINSKQETRIVLDII